MYESETKSYQPHREAKWYLIGFSFLVTCDISEWPCDDSRDTEKKKINNNLKTLLITQSKIFFVNLPILGEYILRQSYGSEIRPDTRFPTKRNFAVNIAANKLQMLSDLFCIIRVLTHFGKKFVNQ